MWPAKGPGPEWPGIHGFILAVVMALLPVSTCGAQDNGQQGPALTLKAAFDIATQARFELKAADARIEASRERPMVASAPDDPVISYSIDHRPVDRSMPTDRSVTIEQRFPLSRVRTHRADAARADIGKYEGEGDKARLRVQADVAQTFFMLNERRRIGQVLHRQLALARQVADVTVARHGTATASQADVLRVETEVARLKNRVALNAADTRAMEAMFNTALGRPSGQPVPPLDTDSLIVRLGALPDAGAALAEAMQARPELRISRAEIERARAEVGIMRSMYAPMAMVRVGRAETMTAGRGYMLMVGLSVPIWLDRVKAGVREATAMSRMAEADREAMVRMIEGDVAASVEALRGAAASHDSYRSDLLPRAERAVSAAMAEYASARAPLSGVLEAARALWSAQEDLAMAEAALGAAWVRYRTAVGTFGGTQ